jgi:methionyl-tRNA formyltransferase
MGKQSIIFLGSKPIGYHCLDYLISQKETLALDIVGVLCHENQHFDAQFSLTQLAKQHQIPVLESLAEMPNVDFIYSVQYHQILKKEDIQKAGIIALNLHMAPLPEYRGCNQFSFALLDNKKEFGTTIHQLDPQIDHGDLLFEKRFPIPENCWIEQLYSLTYDASLLLFKESLKNIIYHNYTLTSQQSLVEERGSQLHYRKDIHEIKKIDLNWDQETIMRHIRATSMPGFEPPYTMIGDKKIYFSTQWH